MEALLSYIDLPVEMVIIGIVIAFVLGLLIAKFTVNDVFDDDDTRNTKPHRFAYRMGCALITVSFLLIGTMSFVPSIANEMTVLTTFIAGGLLLSFAIAH